MIIRSLIITLCCLTSIYANSNVIGEYEKNILIIHSYHQYFEWTDELNRGLIEELNPEENRYFVQIEYLDFKRYQKQEIYESIFNLMKTKYSDVEFDIIITTDDAALDFIKIHKDYFRGIPKVFCGINNYSDSLLFDINDITGVAEENDIKSTLNLISELHPERKNLYIISDTTFTTREVLKLFNSEIGNEKFDYSTKILVSKSDRDLFNEFNSIEQDSAIILVLGYFLDEKGRLDSYKIRLKNLSNLLDIPIYGVWNFYLTHGIVGGSLTDSYDQGQTAGNLANLILEGNDPNRISIVKNIKNHYKFDHLYLEKFGIDEFTLPPNSVIINKPDTSLRIDSSTVILFVILIVFLIISTLALIAYSFNKRKAEKNLLKAKEAAETANKLKSEFLAQMSHEIRTPVNTILSFSSLIKSSLIHKIDEDLKNCFSSIENGGKRLIRTIDLIIKMAEVQSGGIELKKEKVNFYSDILVPVVDEFRGLASEKNLKLEILCSTTKNCMNFVDVHTMKQIIANLLDNAVKYTFEGSIELFFNQIGETCRLEIKDTGVGISEKYLADIFEPFTQEEQGYTRKFEGNGLGMALVKKYCELNGVIISIESEKGKGTSVTLEVEYAEELETVV